MIDFLNDLFKAYRKNIRVKSVKYLNTESNGEVAKDKHVVFDLKCESDSGDIFIVEMQKRDQEHFNDRVAYYMDRTVAEQGEFGDDLWKFGVNRVYGIFLLDFNDKGNTSKFPIRHCGLYDYTNKRKFSDLQDFWMISLPKFRKRTVEECKNGLEQWLYIISNSKEMETMPFVDRKPVFRNVKTMAEFAKMSRSERSAYMLEYDAYRTDIAAYDYGMKTSRAEGLAEGRAEGLAEGLAEGERNANLATARKMLAKGFSIDEICEITGLTKEEIAAI
jgi:predicted transposase/invertase (TIGR01784 family)